VKHFAKKMISVLLALMLVMAFVACDKKDDAAGGGEGGVVELRVLNYMDLTVANAMDEVTRIWDVFEKENPDIKVVREDLFNEPFHNKTEAYVASGQVPDVMYAWPSGRSTSLHTQRLLKDLTPFIQRDGIASMFNPVALDPTQQSGNYLGVLPMGITVTNVVFINQEVLRDCGLQPAKTYAEMKAQVPVLKAKGYETILMANQDTWVMQSCLFSLVAGRFCGEGWEKKIQNGTAKFTDADFVAALQFIKTMYDDGVLSKNTLTTGYGDVVGQFATNKGAYMIDGDWRAGAFITDQSTGEALIPPAKQRNILIDTFPDIEGAKINRSNSAVVACGFGMSAAIPAGSPKEDAAWRLIKYLSGKEVQTFRVATGGVPTPSRLDIDMGSLNLEPITQAVGNLGKTFDKSTVVIDAVFDGPVYDPINDGLQAMGLGTQTPQRVAAIAQAAYEAWKAGN
jgi:raffinose/stachyose/melibiose transport system substrate-binding protein